MFLFSGRTITHYIILNNLFQTGDINRAAYKLAREVADTGDALVSISITETMAYRSHRKGKEEVIKEFRSQLDFFKDCEVDFLICEVTKAYSIWVRP